MSAEFLSRVQFALTVSFHYLYPPMTLGLSMLLVAFLWLFLKTKDPIYETMAHFYIKIFALIFTIGVATGVITEFQFGMNWASFSRFAGDIAGSLFGAETLVAFFLESTFLGIMLFGWNKVSRKMHLFSAIMVCLGAHLSSVWIIMLNSWMNTPAGHRIVDTPQGPRAEIVDFWEMALNHSTIERIVHVVFGTWITGAFLVMSISAYYLLKNRHIEFAKRSIKLSLFFAAVTIFLQTLSGHSTGVNVAKYQPAKLAAFEGLYKTEPSSAISLFGIVNEEEERIDYDVSVPGGMSFLVHQDFVTPVAGLDQFPKEDWPPVKQSFYAYHMMLQMYSFMVGIILLALWFWRKQTLWNKRWFLFIMAWSFMLPQIANQSGWFACEVGRQPWVVYGILRRSEGYSHTVPAGEILAGTLMFALMYTVLFAVFVYLLWDKIKHGPESQKQLIEDKPLVD